MSTTLDNKIFDYIDQLPAQYRDELYLAVVRYCRCGEKAELKGVAAVVFALICDNLALQAAKPRRGRKPKSQAPQPVETVDPAEEVESVEIVEEVVPVEDVEPVEEVEPAPKERPKDRKERPKDRKERRSQFVPPTVEEVQTYVAEQGYTVSAQRFIDYYASRGWMVGRLRMRDWRAAVRLWQQNEETKSQTPQNQTNYGISQSNPGQPQSGLPDLSCYGIGQPSGQSGFAAYLEDQFRAAGML